MKNLKWLLFPLLLIIWYFISKLFILFVYNGLLELYNQNILITLIFLSIYTFAIITLPSIITITLSVLINSLYSNNIIKNIFSILGMIGFLDAVFVLMIKGKFYLFELVFLNFSEHIFKNLIFIVLLISTFIASVFLSLSPSLISDKNKN